MEAVAWAKTCKSWIAVPSLLAIISLPSFFAESLGKPDRDLAPSAQKTFIDGTTALKSGDYDTAIRAFQKVLSLDNEFAPAFLNLGLAYHLSRRYERAIEAFTKALELDRDVGGAALFLGIDYYEINSPEKAIKPLEKALAATPEDPEAHLWLGRSLLAAGRISEAIPHLDKGLAANPDDPGLMYTVGRSHLLLAQKIFEDLYNKFPHSSWVHLFLGQSFRDEGKTDLAIAEYKEALQSDPKIRGAHEALGDLYLKGKGADAAEAEYTRELEIDPYNYGVVCKQTDLLIQRGDLDRAVAILEGAAQKAPSLGCAQYELGRAWFRKGQFQVAAEHLEIAVAHNPEYAPAYVLLGQAYSKTGNREKAEAAFQKGRDLRDKQLRLLRENLTPVGEPLERTQPRN
jgi:tetratricopeptide (TPR) repeat protein